MKHTPGPWHKDHRDAPQIHSQDHIVAWTLYWSGSENAAETHANAQLIAAAPELLEALQEYERVRQASWRGLHKAAMKAQAAITKATGGEHE